MKQTVDVRYMYRFADEEADSQDEQAYEAMRQARLLRREMLSALVVAIRENPSLASDLVGLIR